MDPRCQGKMCLRFVNPEAHPGVSYGTPYEYDPTYGGCLDCQSKVDTEAVHQLISDAAKAAEMVDEDELEHFALQLKKRRAT